MHVGNYVPEKVIHFKLRCMLALLKQVALDRHNVRFAVYKRPHVDVFLDICREWFNLVAFTASMESYGTLVVDALEQEGLMFARRYFRQVCSRLLHHDCYSAEH